VQEVTTIGLDIAKQIFHAHGADASGAMVFSRRITRAKLMQFFASQPRCVVAMEACAGAHHWGRELQRLGHDVRLIPPAYVKPFVKRQKNDAADAHAICEAAQRPTMRFVPVKSEAQQASAAVFRARDLLVRQRTQLLNAVRGLLADPGWVAPTGLSPACALFAKIEEPSCALPPSARDVFLVMIASVRALDERIHLLDREIAKRAREDETARRLMTIPGVGPITATALIALARAPRGSWLEQMMARKPRMLVTVALANKTARIVWAVLARGEGYRAPAVAA
jgi:transposase